MTQGVREARNRVFGHLEIKDATAEREGAYACRVTANTLAPAGVNNAQALSIGRISEPIVVKVYCKFFFISYIALQYFLK